MNAVINAKNWSDVVDANNTVIEEIENGVDTNLSKYPEVSIVLAAIQETAPKGYAIALEYPDFISISKPEWDDELEVAVGTANGCFGWSNVTDGDNFKEITDAHEIARLVWQAVAKVGA